MNAYSAYDGKLSDKKFERYVAIFGYEQPQLVKTVMQVLSIFLGDKVHCRGFERMDALLRAIVSEEVCGVLALGGFKDNSVLGWLQHDIKNLPGFSYESAREYVFPPCADVQMPYDLKDIILIVHSMQLGTYGTEENFDLVAALPTLRAYMKVPAGKVTVVIVDDEKRMVTGMKTVLDAWPGITAEVIIQSPGIVPAITMDADVVLLDEGLAGKVCGTDVFELLRTNGFKGIVASTTGGEKPAFTPYHFQRKFLIKDDWDVAVAFVRFINTLLP